MKYFSFLKGKRGDLKALSSLIDYENLTPIVDIPTSPDETKPGWLIKQLEKTYSYIKKYWHQEQLIFIDFFDLDLDSRLDSGEHPLSSLTELIDGGFNLGIVTGLDRDDDYISASSKIVNKYNLPLALRLTGEDILVPRLTLSAIMPLLDYYSGRSSLKVIIDLRIINPSNLGDLQINCSNFLKRIQSGLVYDEIILAGSSIPPSIGTLVNTGSETQVFRSESHLWNILSQEFDITYGDYTVVSPDYSDLALDFRPPITPKIIYTFNDKHYLVRANSVQHHPLRYNQYILIARKVLNHPSFRHLSTSKGEEYIKEISASDPLSKSKQKTGAPESWITATVNQHIDYILSI